MLKDVSELKDIIQFCKKEKLNTLVIGNVQIQFSEMAFIDQIQSVEEMNKELNNLSTKTLADDPDDMTKKDELTDEERMLFWSSNS